MDPNRRGAFVTLATNDVYCKGAKVLAQSLRVHNTRKDLVVMITPQVTADERRGLEVMFDKVVDVDVMDSKDATHLALLKRPELGITFTKLHCWTLTDYAKCVFMDADTMVLTNIDELLECEEFSAAPDAGWPDIFNSGVFVFKPSIDTYLALINLADTTGSFDGGDQGLLNTYFSDWLTADIKKHLSFLYNMHSTSSYTYSPAFARFGHNTKVVHFIGAVKPWHHLYDRVTATLYQADGSGVHEERFIREWWSLYYLCEDSINPDQPGTSKQTTDEKFHQWMWKTDQIDYTGKDRYDNLQAKMDQHISASDAERAEEVRLARENKSKLTPNKQPLGSTSEEDLHAAAPPIDAAPDEDPHGSQIPGSFTGRPDKERYELWKSGSVDFMGADQFANIQSRMDDVMKVTP